MSSRGGGRGCLEREGGPHHQKDPPWSLAPLVSSFLVPTLLFLPLLLPTASRLSGNQASADCVDATPSKASTAQLRHTGNTLWGKWAADSGQAQRTRRARVTRHRCIDKAPSL
eukprot:6046877-Pyramimonas_sp.AAC.1